MPEINVDLDKIPDRPYLPIGDYLARLVSVKAHKTRKGARMWVWEWRIVAGIYSGAHINSVTFLTKLSSTLQNHLMTFGKYDTFQIDTDEFIGRKVCLMVGETTTRTGDTIPRVVAVLPKTAFRN